MHHINIGCFGCADLNRLRVQCVALLSPQHTLIWSWDRACGIVAWQQSNISILHHFGSFFSTDETIDSNLHYHFLWSDLDSHLNLLIRWKYIQVSRTCLILSRLFYWNMSKCTQMSFIQLKTNFQLALHAISKCPNSVEWISE